MKGTQIRRWPLLLLGLLLLTLLVVGCSSQAQAQSVPADASAPAQVAQQVPDQGIEGMTWRLVRYRDAEGQMADVLDDAVITMELAEGQASGSAGCNRYFAPYQLKGETLTFEEPSTTRMMCPDPVMDQEKAFLDDLTAVQSFQVEDDRLILQDAQGEAILVFAAPDDTASAQPEPMLVGPSWQWTRTLSEDGSEILVDDPSKYVVQFQEDGSVLVKADCKTAVGTFTDDGGSLSMELGPTTAIFCGEGSLADEFLKELSHAATYLFNGNELVINMQMDGGNMHFQPAPPATGPAPTVEPAPTAQPEPTQPPEANPLAPYVGEYKVVLPPEQADGMMLVATLNLNEDGTLTLTLKDLGSNQSETLEGVWEVKDDAVQAQVTTPEGETKAFTMRVNDQGDLQVDGEDFVLTHIDATIPLHKQLPVPVDLSQKAYVTVDLDAGNPLDPFIISVNGGGTLDASALGGDCRGYVNAEPVVRIHWSGKADMSRVFFYSDHDPTLIVQTPDGAFHCNDDANALLLDPSLTFEKPQPGTYNIWVGSYYPDQLLPGFLVVTTRPDVRVETFTLDGLVKRGPMPALTAKLGGRAPDALMDAIQGWKKDVKTAKPGKALSLKVTADGDIPAFEFNIPGQICNGFIKGTPDLVFDWAGGKDPMSIFFEGDKDTTLLVITPNGKILCNDDADPENMNPLVTIEKPGQGRYAVFVGRVHPEDSAKGTLTVTDVSDAGPEVLAPVKAVTPTP